MTDQPKKPGRPKSPQPKANLSAWILAEHYDRLVRRAKARDVSVSGYVRTIVARDLQPKKRHGIS